MRLEKCYLDLVGADGRGLIAYSARLGGMGLGATVAATLAWGADPSELAAQRRTLRGRMPDSTGSSITWRCAAVGVEGVWERCQPSGDELTLWEGSRGFVRWQLLAPLARAEVKMDGRDLRGWGYAERLALDVAPTSLPIDALRWGRFLAPGQSVVWIEWAHETPRRWLFHNGELQAQASMAISGSGVSWRGGRLEFSPGRPLRAGRLDDTLLARWPRMRCLLPRAVRAFRESKWCAVGRLETGGGAAACGWVIHELVQLR